MLTLNAFQLRAAADYAASLRGTKGDDVYITGEITEPNGFMELGNVPIRNGEPPSSTVIARVNTPDVTPREPLTFAEIGVGTQSPPSTIDLLGKYDAVFWSEAAVEKFVIPYYASKSLWMAGHVISVLCAKWYGRVPGEPESTDPPMDGIPFAVAHIPNSDYVTLPDEELTGGSLGDDLVLLSVDPTTGKINEVPLSQYLNL